MSYRSYYSGKTILVTGGAGAIGRNLSEKLALLNAEKVIILDNLSSSYLWNVPGFDNILFVNGDIRNDNDLMRVFNHRPAIVFHLAAFFANQNSVDYPVLNEEVNGIGLIKVLQYSRLAGCVERFVFTNSEGGAYGASSVLPYKEDDVKLDLSTPYYISKLASEAYCKFYYRYYGLPVSTVRLFNSYGPGEVPGQYRNVIPNFIYWAMNKMPLPLTGSSGMSRDFVFVDDIVDGILRAGYYNEAVGEAINIATGDHIDIYQLAQLINDKTGNPAGVTLHHKRGWDIRETILGDTEKMKRLLQYEPSTDFDSGLDLTIEWFRKNWNNILDSAAFTPGRSSAHDIKFFEKSKNTV